MRAGAWAWGKEKDNKLGCKEICINLLGISCCVLILFAIKNLLNGERGFGGGQPAGLAAASQNTTDLRSETLCIELVLVKVRLLSEGRIQRGKPFTLLGDR
jgi:hypothetical protein